MDEELGLGDSEPNGDIGARASATGASDKDGLLNVEDRGDDAGKEDVDGDVFVEREIISTLQLAMLPGLGPRTLTALLDHFGDPESVLTADGPALASVAGIGPKTVHSIRTAEHHVDAEAIARWCRQNGTSIVLEGAPGYPQLLESLDDAPPVLFSQGSITDRDDLAVAIVGTRHATPYGLKQAERFAYSFAKAGVTVVSGLARGIDAAAHQGALAAGGRTIAVLGGGLGELYPKEHASLAQMITSQGAVVSEYSPYAKPRGGMFPQRNRLIAGMTLGTLVIEAPERSGALITARLAYEQNRDVFALPGRVDSRASRGCNLLIRDGAVLVQSVDDVLEAIGPMGVTVEAPSGTPLRHLAELTLNEVERLVLQGIEPSSTSIDEVIRHCELPSQQVIATISVLEMRRLVRRLSGQYVARV